MNSFELYTNLNLIVFFVFVNLIVFELHLNLIVFFVFVNLNCICICLKWFDLLGYIGIVRIVNLVE